MTKTPQSLKTKNEQLKLICEKQIQTTLKSNNLFKTITSIFAEVVHRQRRCPMSHLQLCSYNKGSSGSPSGAYHKSQIVVKDME